MVKIQETDEMEKLKSLILINGDEFFGLDQNLHQVSELIEKVVVFVDIGQ